MTPLYQCDRLHFSYQLGNCFVNALQDVSLVISRGDFVCLSGPSGSGKTTLLNLLGLIEPVQTGDIIFNNKSLKNISESEKNKIRRFKIGFVFQSFQLFPVLRADENIGYFLTRQGLSSLEGSVRVKDALEQVGLWEHRAKKPFEMSGGQRQRVAIARAIAKKPEIIIADEPTASLDQTTGKTIMEIFKKINQERKVTVLISSHDPMVQSYCPKQLLLEDGQIGEPPC